MQTLDLIEAPNESIAGTVIDAETGIVQRLYTFNRKSESAYRKVYALIDVLGK